MFDDHPTVARRLTDEVVAWLTTVSPTGMPQPSPVWFLVEDDTILIYSRDDTSRVRNLAINPRVALHLDGDGRGGAIVVIEGTASIDASAPPAHDNPRYVEKYRTGIANNGWTPETFAADYPVAVRIRPGRLRAW